MGKILSAFKHPFKNFNLESRAHKLISQEKLQRAPLYEKDRYGFERLMKEYPEVYEESLKKNEEMDKHLKQVYVTSTDHNVDLRQKINPNRPLPANRHIVEENMYGAREPDNMPIGKVSLKRALEFISQHQTNPRVYTATKVSEEYNIPEQTVGNIFKYFRVLEIYIPQERQVKATFAGPGRTNVQILKEIKKQLPEPSNNKKKT